MAFFTPKTKSYQNYCNALGVLSMEWNGMNLNERMRTNQHINAVEWFDLVPKTCIHITHTESEKGKEVERETETDPCLIVENVVRFWSEHCTVALLSISHRWSRVQCMLSLFAIRTNASTSLICANHHLNKHSVVKWLCMCVCVCECVCMVVCLSVPARLCARISVSRMWICVSNKWK